MLLLEARAGFEPAITVLQTGALPLGDRALLSFQLVYYISDLYFRQQIFEQNYFGILVNSFVTFHYIYFSIVKLLRNFSNDLVTLHYIYSTIAASRRVVTTISTTSCTEIIATRSTSTIATSLTLAYTRSTYLTGSKTSTTAREHILTRKS